MVATGGDGNNVGQARRWGKLSVEVIPPSHNCAVTFQSQTMLSPCRNLHDIAETGRRRGRAKIIEIVTPANNKSVAVQRQSVSAASHHGNNVGQVFWQG